MGLHVACLIVRIHSSGASGVKRIVPFSSRSRKAVIIDSRGGGACRETFKIVDNRHATSNNKASMMPFEEKDLKAGVDFAFVKLHSKRMADNAFTRFTAAHLKRAAAIKERIEQLERELTGLFGIPEAITLGGTLRRHRRMSAAARAKISAAAKARWAKIRARKR